jgi:hypothetical protein
MHLEHPQAIDRLTILTLDRSKIDKNPNKDCPLCSISYKVGSEIAELSCGYAAHIDCLGNKLAEVIL